MNYILTRATNDLKEQYMEYITEWKNEKIVPYASRCEGADYCSLLKRWSEEATNVAYEKGFVPATLFFLIDENKRIYGAVHIRHTLNQSLFTHGGHIGYGVRPTERQKGVATKMLALALSEAKNLGIEKALVTCDKENIASAKTIISNGGIIENEIEEGNRVTQRYWIKL